MENLSKNELKELIEKRNEVKERKPYFVRQCIYKKKRLKVKWRCPKGSDSKLGNAFGGHAKRVKVGYRGPEDVRGISPAGLFPVMVENVNALALVGQNQGAIISSVVGMKKKLQILEEAKKKNIPVLNVKEIEKYVQDAKAELENRKQERKKKLDRKKKKKAEPKKAEKKEVKPAEEKSVQEQKIEQKKEIDKVLTQG